MEHSNSVVVPAFLIYFPVGFLLGALAALGVAALLRRGASQREAVLGAEQKALEAQKDLQLRKATEEVEEGRKKLERTQQELERKREEVESLTRSREGEIAQLNETHRLALEEREREIETGKAMFGEQQENIGSLHRNIDDLNAAVQEARQACATLRDLSGKLESHRDSLLDYDTTREALQAHLPNLPPALQEFAAGLLRVVDLANRADTAALTDRPGIEGLDLFVYRAPPTFGMLSREHESPFAMEDLLRVTALQGLVHERLQALGLKVLNPAPGDDFDPEAHSVSEQDLVWINDDPSRHNRVASLKRIGYRSGEQVLRKAEVKRYFYNGADGVPTRAFPARNAAPTSPPLPPKPVETGENASREANFNTVRPWEPVTVPPLPENETVSPLKRQDNQGNQENQENKETPNTRIPEYPNTQYPIPNTPAVRPGPPDNEITEDDLLAEALNYNADND